MDSYKEAWENWKKVDSLSREIEDITKSQAKILELKNQ